MPPRPAVHLEEAKKGNKKPSKQPPQVGSSSRPADRKKPEEKSSASVELGTSSRPGAVANTSSAPIVASEGKKPSTEAMSISSNKSLPKAKPKATFQLGSSSTTESEIGSKSRSKPTGPPSKTNSGKSDPGKGSEAALHGAGGSLAKEGEDPTVWFGTAKSKGKATTSMAPRAGNKPAVHSGKSGVRKPQASGDSTENSSSGLASTKAQRDSPEPTIGSQDLPDWVKDVEPAMSGRESAERKYHRLNGPILEMFGQGKGTEVLENNATSRWREDNIEGHPKDPHEWGPTSETWLCCQEHYLIAGDPHLVIKDGRIAWRNAGLAESCWGSRSVGREFECKHEPCANCTVEKGMATNLMESSSGITASKLRLSGLGPNKSAEETVSGNSKPSTGR